MRDILHTVDLRCSLYDFRALRNNRSFPNVPRLNRSSVRLANHQASGHYISATALEVSSESPQAFEQAKAYPNLCTLPIGVRDRHRPQ
ncbi:hypothetical protein KCV03_g257, partial [Aureobasidium melanogenum]